MTHTGNERVVSDWIDAHNARDIEAMLDLAADHLVLRSTTGESSAQGRDEAAAFWASIFSAFPDHRLDPVGFTVDGDRVFAEVVEDGTMTGPLGPNPATGRHFSVPAAFRFDLSDGLIASIATYWDMGAVSRQLGLPV